MIFHGICQRKTFPGYVAPDYNDVLAHAHEVHPFQTALAVYDQAVPGATQLIRGLNVLFKDPVLVIPVTAGEQLKTPQKIAETLLHMSSLRIGGKSLMCVFGGGTVCNFAGFIAAMWNGMEALLIPTNYTAIADVAIGSLHMLNAGDEKNRLQLYRDPLAVVFDPRFMSSLPRFERRSGLAEAVKHAVAQDAVFFGVLERQAIDGSVFDDEPLFDSALRTAQLKDELMAIDPFGERAQCVFLYGHTIAHAIESATQYRLPHGQAVSLGILSELACFHKKDAPLFQRVRALLDRIGLPVVMPPQFHISDVMEHLAHTMSPQGTLRIAHVGELGSLEDIQGHYAAEFDRSEIQRAISAIASP